MPADYADLALDLPGLSGSSAGSPEFTLEAASAQIVADLDRLRLDRVHLCGLSLGAMIALRCAIDQPQRVRSLTLAAGQVRPPRLLMAAQTALMRLLPERLFAGEGVTRTHALVAFLSARS